MHSLKRALFAWLGLAGLMGALLGPASAAADPLTSWTAGPNAILDPTLLAKLPPAVVGAIRFALSDTLHDIYIFAGGILVLALVATFFMREVPLTGARRDLGFEAPPVELEQEDREKAVASA